MERKGTKSSVCCTEEDLFRSLDSVAKSDFYEEALEHRELCQALLDQNQADKSTKLSKKLLTKTNKRRFMAMCVWFQLQEEDENASDSILAEGKGHVCPVYLTKLEAGFGLNASQKAPMCYFLLYIDINYFLNSEHSAICGSAFKSHAYAMIKNSKSSKLKSKAELASSADTKTCLWTKLSMCKEEFSKVPCHKVRVSELSRLFMLLQFL